MSRHKSFLTMLGLTSTLLINGMALAADVAKPEAKPGPTEASPPAALPDPVAVVNGVPISKAAYEVYAQQRQNQRGGADTAEGRKALTDELVIQELLVQEADKQKLDKDPQFLQQLEMVKRNLLATAVVRKVLSEKPIIEEAIKKEYETATAAMAKKEYKARHILVDTEDKAKEIVKEIKTGKDFSELAKAKSSDSSGANGGDLGWFSADMMVQPFGEAVSKLEKGKFSETPVQTQFGWHVIILDDVRDATPPALDELRPQISQMLQGRVLNDYLEKLRAGAKVDIK
jgi:peptidyl-prolyl cis-trans isomerase C